MSKAEHREIIFESMFKGEKIEKKKMFQSPGFRGVEFLPYTNKIKHMVNDVSNQVKINNPHINFPIYQGKERYINVDKRVFSPESGKSK